MNSITKADLEKKLPIWEEVQDLMDTLGNEVVDHISKKWTRGWASLDSVSLDSGRLLINYTSCVMGCCDHENTSVPIEYLYADNWVELYEELEDAKRAEQVRKEAADKLKKEENDEKERLKTYILLKEEFGNIDDNDTVL